MCIYEMYICLYIYIDIYIYISICLYHAFMCMLTDDCGHHNWPAYGYSHTKKHAPPSTGILEFGAFFMVVGSK